MEQNKGGSSNNTSEIINNVFTEKSHQIPRSLYILKTIGEYLLKLVLWLVDLVVSMFTSLWHFIKLIGVGIVKGSKGIVKFFIRKGHQFKFNDIYGKLSFLIFGVSAIFYHQYVFGILYLVFEIGYIVLFILFGVNSIGMLGSLGKHLPGTDPDCTDDFCTYYTGDNSIMILIYGLIWVLSILLFFYIWNRSINNGYTNYRIQNYVKFEELTKKVTSFGEKLDNEAKDAYLNGIKEKDFKVSKNNEIEEVINSFANKDEKDYLRYLFNNTISSSYEHNKEIQKLNNKLNRNKEKVAIKSEKEKEKLENLIKSIDNKIVELGNDEEKIDKLNVKKEVAQNNYNIKVRDLAKKDLSLERKIYEKNKTYVNYVSYQNVRNNNRYGKFNNFYNVTGSLSTEILFYKNYKKFEELYKSSLGKNIEANEENKKKAVELEEELHQKINKTTLKFASIREKKIKIEEEIKAVNVKYNEEVAIAKSSENKETLLNEAKFKQVEAITRLRRQLKEYPSDKIIKSMEKEEIKEAKNAYSRDKKYLKTNFTSESYASEQVANLMLVEYKFEYKDAKYFVAILTQDLKKENKFLSEEEVDEKINSLTKELETYEANHLDKFEGKSKSFKEAIASLFNENFHITILTLPVIGIICFTIIPLLFSILIAFTNYSSGHIPPTQLFTWNGLENFKNLFFPDKNSTYAVLPEALMTTLGWTLIWAIIATFSNYILGIVVALLINKDGIRFKKFFRTIFVLTIAIPQFISLLSIGTLLKDSGAIGQWYFETFGARLGFGTDSSTQGVMIAKIIIILVNVWVGIPYTILSTTGILLNIPKDLYESAKVDGAGSFTQFAKITMPYILFVTGPYLITQFVGNINNFNVIYFLTGGGPAYSGSALLGLGKTDLLITFLYKVITSTNNPQFGIASAVGIFIFVICSFISIVMYNKSGAIKEEDQFQ